MLLMRGTVPGEWKRANIITIYKKDDRNVNDLTNKNGL